MKKNSSKEATKKNRKMKKNKLTYIFLLLIITNKLTNQALPFEDQFSHDLGYDLTIKYATFGNGALSYHYFFLTTTTSDTKLNIADIQNPNFLKQEVIFTTKTVTYLEFYNEIVEFNLLICTTDGKIFPFLFNQGANTVTGAGDPFDITEIGGTFTTLSALKIDTNAFLVYTKNNNFVYMFNADQGDRTQYVTYFKLEYPLSGEVFRVRSLVKAFTCGVIAHMGSATLEVFCLYKSLCTGDRTGSSVDPFNGQCYTTEKNGNTPIINFSQISKVGYIIEGDYITKLSVHTQSELLANKKVYLQVVDLHNNPYSTLPIGSFDLLGTHSNVVLLNGKKSVNMMLGVNAAVVKQFRGEAWILSDTFYLSSIKTARITSQGLCFVSEFTDGGSQKYYKVYCYYQLTTECDPSCKNNFCLVKNDPSECLVCSGSNTLLRITALNQNSGSCEDSSLCVLPDIEEKGLVCVGCDESCNSCDKTRNKCLGCKDGHFGLRDFCYNPCPDKYYGMSSLCLPCHSSCQKCTGDLETQCTECPSGTYLSLGKCETQCPSNQVQSPTSGICADCQTGCSKCTTTTDNCQECSTGYFLDGSACLVCDQNCLQCETTAIKCTSCKETEVDKLLHLKESKCVSSCPNGTYLSITPPNQCLECNANCQKCSGNPDTCTECLETEYLDLGDSKCKPCNTILNCKKCTNASTCTECEPLIPTLYVKSGSCVTDCGDGFFPSSGTGTNICEICHNYCLTCFGSQRHECSSCDPNDPDHFIHHNYRCLKTCPDGKYITPTRTCGDCDTTVCITCQNMPNFCLTCKDPTLTPVNGVCSPVTCNDGLTLINNVCENCLTPCEKCDGKVDFCTSCADNLILHQNKCYSQCPLGTFLLNGICENCDSSCKSCKNDSKFCTSCSGDLTLTKENSCKYIACAAKEFIGDDSECYSCNPECLKCENSASKCLSCVENYEFIEEKNFCKKICDKDLKEIWLEGNECRACSGGCDDCSQESQESKTLLCSIFLDIIIKKSEFQKNDYDLLLDLIILSTQTIDFKELKNRKISNEKLNIKIVEKPELKITNFTVFWNEENKLQTGVKFNNLLEETKKYTIELNFNDGFFSNNPSSTARTLQTPPQESQPLQKKAFKIQEKNFHNKKTEFYTNPKITEKEKKQAIKTSKAVSSSIGASSSPAEYASFIGIITSADESGATMSFSQISKLIARLRLINVNFGELLTTFLDGISKAFDKAEDNKIVILEKGNGSKGKMNFYGVKLFVITFEKGEILNEIKIFIYLFSWLIKILIFSLLYFFKKGLKINEKVVKFILIHRKIHFVLFNMNLINTFFFGTRTLVHSKITEEVKIELSFTFIYYFFMVWDFTDLGWTSSNIKNEIIIKKNDEKKPEENNESKFEFFDHEVKKENFRKRRDMGFGLRNYFYEEDMIKNVMSTEKAKRIGYVRRIDIGMTLNNILVDETKQKHATSELREDPKLYTIQSVLMANFFFLFRIVCYQVIIVTIPHNGPVQVVLLFFIEGSYLYIVVKNYVKYKYLNSCHLFISKFLQSVFLIIFHLLCIIIVFGFKKKPVSLLLQKIGMYSILVAVICEYFFLILNVIVLIARLIKKMREKKKIKDGKNSEEKKKYVVYKWVRDIVVEREIEDGERGGMRWLFDGFGERGRNGVRPGFMSKWNDLGDKGKIPLKKRE